MLRACDIKRIVDAPARNARRKSKKFARRVIRAEIVQNDTTRNIPPVCGFLGKRLRAGIFTLRCLAAFPRPNCKTCLPTGQHSRTTKDSVQPDESKCAVCRPNLAEFLSPPDVVAFKPLSVTFDAYLKSAPHRRHDAAECCRRGRTPDPGRSLPGWQEFHWLTGYAAYQLFGTTTGRKLPSTLKSSRPSGFCRNQAGRPQHGAEKRMPRPGRLGGSCAALLSWCSVKNA